MTKQFAKVQLSMLKSRTYLELVKKGCGDLFAAQYKFFIRSIDSGDGFNVFKFFQNSEIVDHFSV